MIGICEAVGADLCALVAWSSHYVLCLTPGSGSGDCDHPADQVNRDLIVISVDRLPTELVVALWLVDVCELSYADAAWEAGVTRETLASRLHRARHAIALDVQAALPET
jgi:DNA-directed RNA polymerase specialized sigma24 family protein